MSKDPFPKESAAFQAAHDKLAKLIAARFPEGSQVQWVDAEGFENERWTRGVVVHPCTTGHTVGIRTKSGHIHRRYYTQVHRV